MNFRRYIARSGRMQRALERKYSKLLRAVLLEQLRIYSETLVWQDLLTPLLSELYLDVGERYYLTQRKLFDDIQKDTLFLEVFRVWFSSYTQTVLAEKIVNINDTTRNRVKEVLGDLIPQSVEFKEMISELTSDVAFSAKRAKTIVRTEVGGAMNKAKEKSYEEQLGAMYKIWIHRGGGEPRDWHKKLDNGKAIPADSDFVVVDDEGNVEMMSRPHDESASAGNVINCGCEVIYITEQFALENGYL